MVLPTYPFDVNPVDLNRPETDAVGVTLRS